MSRLPTVGGDDNTWGNVLNDFLGVEHNADGTQKTLDISKGGTGATDVATARTSLGTISNSDARLSDARTPTAHAATHLGGSDDMLANLDGRYAAATAVKVPVLFSKTGTLSVTTGASRFPVTATGTIVAVWAAVGTAPTGAAIICDVDKNGSTVFTTQANRPSIADGANVTTSAAVPDITSVTAGDLLSVNIDQVGSTTPGADLTVVVVIQE